MNVTYRDYSDPLGRDADAWVRDNLARGGALSSKVLAHRDLSRGSVCVLGVSGSFNETIRNHPLRDAAPTGAISAEQRDIALVKAVAQFHTKKSVLVIEDELALPKDNPSPRVEGTGVCVVESMVLRYIDFDFGDDDANLLPFVHTASHGYPMNAFLFLDANIQLVLQSLLTRESARARGSIVDRHLVMILNSAFDNETYCMWESSSITG